MKNLFDYCDYRSFLKDWYVSKKKNRFAYSYGKFSRVAGFSSPNYFKQVMDGHRNLSMESAEKFSKALGLSLLESIYFKLLVKCTQEKDTQSQEKLKQGLDSLRRGDLAEKIMELNREITSISPVENLLPFVY